MWIDACKGVCVRLKPMIHADLPGVELPFDGSF